MRVKCSGKCELPQFARFLAASPRTRHLVGIRGASDSLHTKIRGEAKTDEIDLSSRPSYDGRPSNPRRWREIEPWAIDSTTTRHMDRARFGLVAATVLLGAWACARVVGYFNGPAHAGDRVAQAMARGAPDANEVKPYLDKAREAAEALKKKNLFSKEPPKEHPVKQIDGILGAEVLIGDKLYKVGQKVGDATIIAIEPTQVTVELNVQQKTFSSSRQRLLPSVPPGPPNCTGEDARSRPPRPDSSRGRCRSPPLPPRRRRPAGLGWCEGAGRSERQVP
jgi:hypothetical protein